MDQISPDLLLKIFKELSSKEMVSVMRVERKWLQIIDENKALWKELVLPPRRNGWGLQGLELFDRKSNSTLKRVSMKVGSGVESGPFVETLERSKDTLRVLDIKVHMNYRVEEALKENLGRFPNLVECRLTSASTRHYILSLQLGEGDEDEEDNKGSSLRVLWISHPEKLIKSHLYLLDNLASLVLLDGRHGFVEMRRILERPSRTLKHLRIAFGRGEEPQIPTLSFPNLTFLDIDLHNRPASVFPSWMQLPPLSTLIIRNSRTLSSLPACSKLWLFDLDEFEDLFKLASQCSELVEMKMNLSGARRYVLSASERIEKLSLMLSRRKANVEAGMEIEGVKMSNLKTLVVPFEHVGYKKETDSIGVGLSKLRELVEEVIDLRGVLSEIIEIEV